MLRFGFRVLRAGRVMLKRALGLVLATGAMAFYGGWGVTFGVYAVYEFATTGTGPKFPAAFAEVAYIGVGAALFAQVVMVVVAVMVYLGAPYALVDRLEGAYSTHLATKADKRGPNTTLRLPGSRNSSRSQMPATDTPSANRSIARAGTSTHAGESPIERL